MSSKDTINRQKRRAFLYDIICNFVKLYAEPDNRLKIIPMIKLNNIRMDTLNFLKWLNIEYREGHDTHISVFGGDAVPTAYSKKTTSLKGSELN